MAQVSYERLVKAAEDSGNRLTYSGTYRSWRYSELDQIRRENARSLKVKWIYQMPTMHVVETTPLVRQQSIEEVRQRAYSPEQLWTGSCTSASRRAT
jgi:glucose dehydrogenase